MKKILLLILAIYSINTQAQDLIKVKGNREVTTQISPLDSFDVLEIDGEYEIEIVPGAVPQIEITTDSNLHQYLAASVVKGKLVVTTTARIRSKKELKFRIIYGPELKKISVTDDAQLSSVTSLQFEELELNIEKDAEVYLTATIDNLTLNAERSTKSELNLTGKQANIRLTDNASVKALVKYEKLDLSLDNRVDARIEGDVKRGTLSLKDRAQLEGKNLVFDNLELMIKNNAQASVNVKNNFSLEATDDAEIAIHNNPDFDIKKFTGKAVLKKE
ncbi:GIN domain-containing protein [Nonlabens xiamenensis]|uniref:GIN domain-containing protein n=1 Tax=Nonlabens xiamenensis TaxID=2341043 RepID=UPI000F608597|nr:DUF2807 domain-containing protein [Nonlabens xiamenensis]